MPFVICPICKKEKRTYSKGFVCCGCVHPSKENFKFKPKESNSPSLNAKSSDGKEAGSDSAQTPNPSLKTTMESGTVGSKDAQQLPSQSNISPQTIVGEPKLEKPSVEASNEEPEPLDIEVQEEVDISGYDFQCSKCSTYAYLSDIQEKGVCPVCQESI